LHFATHFIVGPSDAALWLRVFRFPFSEAATATKGAAESPPGAGGGFPRGGCEVWGVIAGRGVGGGLFGVCNLKRFSDSEKLQPLLLLPFVGFNFSFAGQKRR